MKDKLVHFIYPQTLSIWIGYTTCTIMLSLPAYFLMAISGIMVSELLDAGEGNWMSTPFLCWHVLLWMRGVQGMWLLGKTTATRGEATSAIAWLMVLVMFQLFTIGIAFADWSLRF